MVCVIVVYYGLYFNIINMVNNNKIEIETNTWRNKKYNGDNNKKLKMNKQHFIIISKRNNSNNIYIIQKICTYIYNRI